ncbi:MAG: hypothetical protein ABID40_04940 [Candidatus Bipolaricaulota bacterium]
MGNLTRDPSVPPAKTLVRFPEHNKVSYGQDFAFWEGAPSCLAFSVRDKSDSKWTLIAPGYGGAPYGNGAIFVSARSIRPEWVSYSDCPKCSGAGLVCAGSSCPLHGHLHADEGCRKVPCGACLVRAGGELEAAPGTGGPPREPRLLTRERMEVLRTGGRYFYGLSRPWSPTDEPSPPKEVVEFFTPPEVTYEEWHALLDLAASALSDLSEAGAEHAETPPPDAGEIVRRWLAMHGYDGLYNPDFECGCPAAALAPCEGTFDRCLPGVTVPSEEGNCIGPMVGTNPGPEKPA